MTLFETAAGNPALEYICEATGKSFSLTSLPYMEFEGKAKELVFAYLDNSVHSIAVFWSLMRSPHCLVLLSPALGQQFKDELEALYRPAFVFDAARTEINGYAPLQNGAFSFFRSQQPEALKIHPQIKLLLSTSGTTGSPKFVKLSEDNLLSNAQSISTYLPIVAQDVTPLNLPIYYSYGLSVLTSNSIKGGKIVCSNTDVLKKEFWENFSRFGYTSIAGVPFVYEMLDRIGFTKKRYLSLRYFTQAGGKLQDPLVKKYAEYALAHDVAFYVMYGQTEATARMSYLDPRFTLAKTGSIGKAIPGGHFHLDGGTGELLYEGANVFGGYVQEPKDLQTYEQPSLLRTGDMARRDEDGFYYITGRIKRFTKLFGSRINLDEVESIISRRLKINAKCTGLNDQALLVFISENEADPKALRQFISEELKLHVSVIRIYTITELPLTSNGKVNYNQLIESYANS